LTAPVKVYTNAPKRALLALLGVTSVSGTPKLMLATASYTPDQDAHDFVNDITNEAAGTSYTAGGITLTTVAVNLDGSTNTVTLDADDITTASLSVSCRWGIIYVDTGTASTSPLIAYVDLSEGVGGNVTVTGITWNASGIVPFVVA
jgi:hypothetical protein